MLDRSCGTPGVMKEKAGRARRTLGSDGGGDGDDDDEGVQVELYANSSRALKPSQPLPGSSAHALPWPLHTPNYLH